jgi:hypothetical protein
MTRGRGKWSWIRTVVGGDLCGGVPVNHREIVGGVGTTERERRRRCSWGGSEERIRKKWGVYMGKHSGDVRVSERKAKLEIEQPGWRRGEFTSETRIRILPLVDLS